MYTCLGGVQADTRVARVVWSGWVAEVDSLDLGIYTAGVGWSREMPSTNKKHDKQQLKVRHTEGKLGCTGFCF